MTARLTGISDWYYDCYYDWYYDWYYDCVAAGVNLVFTTVELDCYAY